MKMKILCLILALLLLLPALPGCTPGEPDVVEYPEEPGNTPCNIAAGGAVARQGGTLYYALDAERFVGAGLYRGGTDGTGERRLAAGAVGSINVAGSWVYYTSGDRLYRVGADGGTPVKLLDGCRTAFVRGSSVYFLSDGGALARADLVDGSRRTLVGGGVLHFEFADGRLFYSTADGLYELAPEGNAAPALVLQPPPSAWFVDGEWLCTAVYDGAARSNRIVRRNLADGSTADLAVPGDRIVALAPFKDTLVYTTEAGETRRIGLDGSNGVLLCRGRAVGLYSFDQSLYLAAPGGRPARVADCSVPYTAEEVVAGKALFDGGTFTAVAHSAGEAAALAESYGLTYADGSELPLADSYGDDFFEQSALLMVLLKSGGGQGVSAVTLYRSTLSVSVSPVADWEGGEICAGFLIAIDRATLDKAGSIEVVPAPAGAAEEGSVG